MSQPSRQFFFFFSILISALYGLSTFYSFQMIRPIGHQSLHITCILLSWVDPIISNSFHRCVCVIILSFDGPDCILDYSMSNLFQKWVSQKYRKKKIYLSISRCYVKSPFKSNLKFAFNFSLMIMYIYIHYVIKSIQLSLSEFLLTSLFTHLKISLDSFPLMVRLTEDAVETNRIGNIIYQSNGMSLSHECTYAINDRII